MQGLAVQQKLAAMRKELILRGVRPMKLHLAMEDELELEAIPPGSFGSSLAAAINVRGFRRGVEHSGGRWGGLLVVGTPRLPTSSDAT